MRILSYGLIILSCWISGQKASALCVSSSVANLRSGPSTKYKVTWTVGKYMPLLQVSRKGSWIKVKDLDGEAHWIHRNLITNDYDCLVVRSIISNLRTGPGPSNKLAFIKFADRFTPFRKLDRRGNWLLVEDDYKSRAWIYDRNVWEPLRRSRIEF